MHVHVRVPNAALVAMEVYDDTHVIPSLPSQVGLNIAMQNISDLQIGQSGLEKSK